MRSLCLQALSWYNSGWDKSQLGEGPGNTRTTPSYLLKMAKEAQEAVQPGNAGGLIPLSQVKIQGDYR